LKEDLSKSISKHEGLRLEKITQIIHEGVSEIRNTIEQAGTKEIELKILDKNFTNIQSFEEIKKDFGKLISKHEGLKLEKIIQIIHEGVPEIRNMIEHSGWHQRN
jgi:phage-related tail protein